MRRRQFIGGMLAVAGLAGCRRGSTGSSIPGEIVGANHQLGHRLRSGGFSAPSRQMEVKVVILGGGVAGLSAAWKLARSGLTDFHLLELESETGGNSRFAEYPASASPWGAHYLPVPTRESMAVRELLSELGLIRGVDAKGNPDYVERYLCQAPQERLFLYGRWQEGLFPRTGASGEDFGQLDSFHRHVEGWKTWLDPQGRRAFAIPIDLSSQDPQLLALDRISMADHLKQHGWTSPRLRWYVEYGCRDDYGCTLETTSAWAGLHYFASRDGGGYSDPNALFTWPEGNGFLVRHLRQSVASRATPQALVFNVEPFGDRVRVDYLDATSQQAVRVVAEHAVYAMPTFTARYVLAPWRQQPPEWLSQFTYAPWAVANVVLNRLPPEREANDISLCWDNVVYDSPSLGYVAATHQSLRYENLPTVLTWYRPFTGDPAAERQRLLDRSWESFRDEALNELEMLHPGIGSSVSCLDVMRYGHAMIRPAVGFMWGGARRQAAQGFDRVHFAHSDLSGISIFEEAQYRGIEAAEKVMAALGHPFKSSLA